MDCTFGRGGHSRAILARLGERGRLIALDRDPEAVRRGADDRRCALRRAARELSAACARCWREHGVDAVDGMLLDLGVSSPQLDDAARGFSFRLDGPLDMRMDTSRGHDRRAMAGERFGRTKSGR